MHSWGWSGFRDIKLNMEGILSENIKIPYNYLLGQFSNPEKISININFVNYKKLEYKRKQALDLGVLISSGDDYVPATIDYQGKTYNVKLRLKGDQFDHLTGNKWSFRIKVKGDDTLFGMRIFSIQKPKTRMYLNELIYHYALKEEGVMSLRFKFVEVAINGENRGIYALEEHFGKELMADNNRREGVFLKFNEDLVWEEGDFSEEELFYGAQIDSFEENKILQDPIKTQQFEKARNLLESFRKGSLKTSEVFDIDKLAKYFAISTLMNCEHGSEWINIRFYYNPVTSLLEPIGNDGYCIHNPNDALRKYLPNQLYALDENYPEKIGTFYDLIFSDKVFFKEYMKELQKVSQKSYLEELFLKLDKDLKRNIRIIHKDTPWYPFSKQDYYDDQEEMGRIFNPPQAINAYFQKNLSSQNKITLLMGNINQFPLEIVNLDYNGSIFEFNQGDRLLQPKNDFLVPDYKIFEFKIPSNFEWRDEYIKELKINYKIFGTDKVMNQSIMPWPYTFKNFMEKDFIRQESNFSSFEFLEVDENNKNIFIKNGEWALNKSLIIPSGYDVYVNEGTTIDLIKGSLILSYSPVQFLGTKEKPIIIQSSDKTGQGLVVLNANKISNIKYVLFKDLTSPSKEGWDLTGAITFYKSPVNFDNVLLDNMNSEDSLDIVSSKYEIKNSVFKNCFSDCLDDDFGNGILENSSFINCGNDCLDFSGSEAKIINLDLFNAGDKGISAGEKSNISVENIKIDEGYIGIASKDQSKIIVANSQISNTEYAFAIYQKKPEFGPSSINAINVDIFLTENKKIVEKNSKFLLNDLLILGGEEKVYEKLYGDAK